MGEFASGVTSGPSETSSLKQRADRFNEQTPGKFNANGLNQQIMPSGNGMSARDASRITPSGMLPSQNGMSASTYGQIAPKYGMTLNI